MEEKLIESVKTSLIDKNNKSFRSYEHEIITNRNEKIIIKLRNILKEADEFIISVAFMTMSGLILIIDELKELEKRNIKGKILTGDYLNFTEPKVLRKLLEFKNIELRIVAAKKFHAKGYFVKNKNVWNMIIGSSNLTQTALTTNLEWNLSIKSMETGKIYHEIMDEFYEVFNDSIVPDEEYLKKYEKIYNEYKKFKNLQNINENIKPNSMQRNALENLKNIRETEDRALLISATGTGKTYISAFDVKNFNPKKILFLAHRKKILNLAIKSYKNVIKDKNIGLYEKDENFDYLFAMVQTMSKDRHLKKFKENEFDYIIIDEVHHSGAKSYLKIIDYFKPKFLLGMTATPERTDDFDIFSLFNHNIAYEIRLYDALKQNLLTPFHYFGISDIIIDGKEINEDTSINDLTLDDRINHIIEKSKFYGYSGDSLKCLIFVSRQEEAKIMSQKFRDRNLKAVALLGTDSENFREETINKLENGEINYIITVDIFNEGIDIPSVNQIIMLRPTTSAIIYIQQLGRGLRLFKNKEYVVILDFIGNYEKNFLIPLAISQDNSYNKDYLKQFLLNGTNMIPGESTIIFEEQAIEKIIENINKNNFSIKKNIEKDYIYLKQKLGRIPYLYDFISNNMISPNVILKYKKTYDEVLRILEPNLEFQKLNAIENNYLRFLYTFFIFNKRIYEIQILKYLLENKKIYLKEEENIDKMNAILHLEKEIFKNLSTYKPYERIIKKQKNYYILEESFISSYENNLYFKKLIDDIIKTNIFYVNKYYDNAKNIEKYKGYSKMEAFWLLNLDFNNGYQVSGYTAFEEERKIILFITLDLEHYSNEFFDKSTFTWYSKEKRVLSRNNKLTIEGKIANNYYELEVFIKKKTGEDFYYVGKVKEIVSYKEIKNSKENDLVEYILRLEEEIDENLFRYFTKIN